VADQLAPPRGRLPTRPIAVSELPTGRRSVVVAGSHEHAASVTAQCRAGTHFGRERRLSVGVVGDAHVGPTVDAQVRGHPAQFVALFRDSVLDDASAKSTGARDFGRGDAAGGALDPTAATKLSSRYSSGCRDIAHVSNGNRAVQLFLCSLFAPVCLTTVDKEIYPCRSLCQAVQNGCEGRMRQYGFPWPEMLNCNKYPVENDMCIQPVANYRESLLQC
jgi:hypothetical protein